MKKVYIVILNYNGWKDTIECIESLLKLNYCNYKIIVCDNKSKDNSIEYIKKWLNGEIEAGYPENKLIENLVRPFSKKPINFEHIRFRNNNFEFINNGDEKIILLESDYNRGFSGGNNLAIRYIKKYKKYDYIWFINNDIVVDKNALVEMLKTFERDKNIGMTSSVMCEYRNPKIVQTIGGFFDKYDFSTKSLCEQINIRDIEKINIDNIETLGGASIILSKKFIDDIDCFDEKYFLYYEECDLSMRAKEKKWNIKPTLRSIVYHKGSVTAKTLPSAIIEYHFFKSRTLFVRKYYKKKLIFVFITVMIKVLKRLAYLKVKNAYNIFKGFIDGIYIKLN